MKKEKEKYSMWQVLQYFIGNTWQMHKSIILFSAALVLLMAGQHILELLVSPAILTKIETKAPISGLLVTIAVFVGGILLTSGVNQYIRLNFTREKTLLRLQFQKKIADKYTTTSYINMMDPEFGKKHMACCQNCTSGSNLVGLWDDITAVVWNFVGLVLFAILLCDFHPLLMVGILALAAAGWFIGKKLEYVNPRTMDEIENHFQQSWYVVNTLYDPNKGKDIRIFHMQEWLVDIYQRILNAMWNWYRKRETSGLWMDVTDVAIAVLRNGVGYAILIIAVIKGSISVPEFLLYTAAVGGFASWVTGLCQGLSGLRTKTRELSVILEFMNTPEIFRFEEGEELPDLSQGCEIALEHVSFRYPNAEVDAVHDVDLVIRPGEKVAVVGINGAGKTTLVNLILGLLDPTEGCIKLNGIDVRKLNRESYYRLFSAVFQSFEAFCAPIRVNIAPGTVEYDDEKMWAALEMADLKEKVQSLPDGMDTYYGDFSYFEAYGEEIDQAKISCTELSGGELQRLMLARALYKDGDILILDEPTAALDPIAENEVYQKYDKMTRAKTSVFISHRLATTRFCDRILYMDHGEVTEQGTHEELMQKQGAYADLFQVQSRYYQEEKEAQEDEEI